MIPLTEHSYCLVPGVPGRFPCAFYSGKHTALSEGRDAGLSELELMDLSGTKPGARRTQASGRLEAGSSLTKSLSSVARSETGQDRHSRLDRAWRS